MGHSMTVLITGGAGRPPRREQAVLLDNLITGFGASGRDAHHRRCWRPIARGRAGRRASDGNPGAKVVTERTRGVLLK
jgi:hypothetical protein